MLSAILRNSTSNWLVVYALLVFFTGFCASAFGAVPYRAKDVAVDENFQYIDRELKQKLSTSGGTITGSLSVSGSVSASSATFSGLVVISSYSASSNGFTYLPGGLILQWGTSADLAPNSSVTVTLPKAWPNGLLSASVSHKGLSGTGTTHTSVFVQATSGNETTQITISKGLNGGGAAGTFPVFWQAIGY